LKRRIQSHCPRGFVTIRNETPLSVRWGRSLSIRTEPLGPEQCSRLDRYFELTVEPLLKSPAIPGLTESLTNLNSSDGEQLWPGLGEQDSLREKIRIILNISIHILSFGNTLASNSVVNKRVRGRNVIGGSIIIIGRLRRSCRKALGRWSRSS